MGVSILVEWPGSTEDEQGGHPGFENDDHLWATWVVTVIEDPKVAADLRKIGCEVLLRHNTSNLDPNEIGWGSPREFESAALKLRKLVDAKDPAVQTLLDTYRVEWGRLIGEDEDEERGAEQWFAQDLQDVAAIAKYAGACGAKKMTLAYYW